MAQVSRTLKPAGRRALLAARSERNLTQLKAAVAIGISPVTLSRAEAGDPIQPKTLAQIAGFYGIEIEELVGRAS